jgi:hypothetical protein
MFAFYALSSDPDPLFFGPIGSGSVIICTNPDPSINEKKS